MKETPKAVELSKVKLGDYIRLAPGENAPVWIRGDYDRAEKKYMLESWGDIGRTTFRKGTTKVYIDFEF